ncbi:YlcI/YnfO family protein [Pectobacterium aroidearum]|uniref:YlcI/YnfO family protein n=1 Tax=Pectobacterium aroidearum TaxID=1201031 RepID=UPI0015F3BCCC|nr:YlcI/YnfO family protein [Pectobacterium aroidearum]MBA5602060.1 hypothetical protein [Pectobacterium aroidearum]
MATGPKNTKSQSLTARIPHEVIEDMEAVKQEGESTAGFIVSAMRGEIARRQSEGAQENPLLSSLDALARIEEIGTKVGEEMQKLVNVARNERQRK